MFPAGASGIQQAFFGQGTGDIVFDDVMCVGTEARLTDCPAVTTHNCIHAEDASVICAFDPGNACTSDIHAFMLKSICVHLVPGSKMYTR